MSSAMGRGGYLPVNVSQSIPDRNMLVHALDFNSRLVGLHIGFQDAEGCRGNVKILPRHGDQFDLHHYFLA
jgi:hypothetical protein